MILGNLALIAPVWFESYRQKSKLETGVCEVEWAVKRRRAATCRWWMMMVGPKQNTLGLCVCHLIITLSSHAYVLHLYSSCSIYMTWFHIIFILFLFYLWRVQPNSPNLPLLFHDLSGWSQGPPDQARPLADRHPNTGIHWSMDWLDGKILTGNFHDVPIKYMRLSCKFSLKPIHWIKFSDPYV